ncbi:MAG: ribosomal protein [Candidatus Saccharibacteria bacterium]|nr:ribosomal protein [Candidatus Saccharibacteria bacterium]
MATAKTPTTKATPKVAEDQILEAEVAEVVEAKNEVRDKNPAKAGKRSAKAAAAAEAEAAKEERKAEDAETAPEDAKPRQAQNPTRSRLARQGKNFRAKAELIDKSKAYSLKEAIKLAVETNPVKFDATVELHVNLNVNPRHADQNLRDNLVLPAGTGKTVKVAVFDDATVEGADISGVETLTKQLEKGTIDFDILIATPAQMPKLGKYARLLGPRGLMPNPKSGTVTTDVAKAVTEAKAGRVEYRVDSTGIVHLGIGKVSFGADKLLLNAQAVYASLKSNKPASVKGIYVKTIHIASTMGPSITVEPTL